MSPETVASHSLTGLEVASFAAGGGDTLDDEIHNWLWIRWGERVMTFAFLDHDRDLPTEFLVSLLGNPRLGFEPRITAAAKVEERHSRVGQQGQIVERLRFRHVAS